MECTVSSNVAQVSWYKGKTKLEVILVALKISVNYLALFTETNVLLFAPQDGEQFSISKDMSGVCRLTIKSATLEDSGEYSCKINKQTDKTDTVVTIVGEHRFYLTILARFFTDIFCSKFQNLQKLMIISSLEYPYKFVKVLKHQQLVEKETLTLLCELDDAGGDVQWFKGDQAITPDKRYVYKQS